MSAPESPISTPEPRIHPPEPAGPAAEGGSEPRVSVIIPTYNRAALVREAVQSALAQTFTDFEIVVVDDGSTDDTPAALATYARRIRYVRQENRGVAAAWNRGIRESRGAFLAFLCSDDLWVPEALRTVMEAFDRHPEAALVSYRAREITAGGARTGLVYGKRSRGAIYTTRGLLREDSGGCSWFVARREALERIGLFDESLRSAEDCDLCLRLSFEATLVGIRQPLLLRRRHDGNLSGDRLLNAREWIRLLDKLARQRPGFVRRHPWVYRRTLGKAFLRLGREILAVSTSDPRSHAEARAALRNSVRVYPFFVRGWIYLGWSYLAPSTYSRWRRFEMSPPPG